MCVSFRSESRAGIELISHLLLLYHTRRTDKINPRTLNEIKMLRHHQFENWSFNWAKEVRFPMHGHGFITLKPAKMNKIERLFSELPFSTNTAVINLVAKTRSRAGGQSLNG